MIETIFEIAVTLLFIWLFFKALKLTLKITWGLTKIIAIILFIVAPPLLVCSLIFAGGAILLLPLSLIVGAFVIVKSCIT